MQAKVKVTPKCQRDSHYVVHQKSPKTYHSKNLNQKSIFFAAKCSVNFLWPYFTVSTFRLPFMILISHLPICLLNSCCGPCGKASVTGQLSPIPIDCFSFRRHPGGPIRSGPGVGDCLPCLGGTAHEGSGGLGGWSRLIQKSLVRSPAGEDTPTRSALMLTSR